jgi:hypothetical protein
MASPAVYASTTITAELAEFAESLSIVSLRAQRALL